MRYGKGIIAVIAVGAVVAGPAVAKRPQARVETQAYEVGSQVGGSTLGPLVAAATFPAGAERFAEFAVEDSSGTGVLAEIVQDDRVDTFCGATEEAIPITPGFPVEIRLFEGRCLDGSPSVVAGGLVTAKFFSRNPSIKRASSQERSYSLTAPGSYVGFDPPLPGNVIIANVTFPGGPQPFVSLHIDDVTGGTVGSVVYQGDREIGRFCGKTSKPLPVGRWEPFTVDLHMGVCMDGVQSAPTNGVINADFVKGT